MSQMFTNILQFKEKKKERNKTIRTAARMWPSSKEDFQVPK